MKTAEEWDRLDSDDNNKAERLEFIKAIQQDAIQSAALHFASLIYKSRSSDSAINDYEKLLKVANEIRSGNFEALKEVAK